MSTASTEAKQAAGTAADQSKHVAGVARDEARNVVEESKQQAQALLEEAKTQLDEQSRTQRDRLVSTLRTFGDDVERMANGERTGGGMAQDLARQVADRAHELGSRIDGREPTELLDEVRSFARRRPGTFLLGALAAGVVAGRLTRGAKDGRSATSDPDRTPLYDEVRGTATGTPTAGTGHPVGPAAYPAGSGVGEPGTTMEQNAADSPWIDEPATTQRNPADAPWVDEPGRRGTA